MRTFCSFTYKNTNFRLSEPSAEIMKQEIIKQREILETYINIHPDFLTSLLPVKLQGNPPYSVLRMHEASLKTGVGPMAGVAGIMSELAVKAALSLGTEEAIADNGGDIFIHSGTEVLLSVFAGKNPFSGKLAFKITPALLPVSVCSSSSKMGHSLSFGDCDLATVFSADGALADCAATLACNSVKQEKDINSVLEKIAAIEGVRGVLIIKNSKIGMAGSLPELIRLEADINGKICHDLHSDFKLHSC